MKWIALVALDALGICYKAVAAIWHLPYGEEVLATCVAVSICLAALLGISTARYKKELVNAPEELTTAGIETEKDGE